MALGAGLLLLPLARPASPLGDPLADLWDLICRAVPVGLAEAAGAPMETMAAPATPIASAMPLAPAGRDVRPAARPSPGPALTPASLFAPGSVGGPAASWPGRPLTPPPLPPVFVARDGRTRA